MSDFRSKNAQTQTDIRLKLLANGFVPTPNHDKRCFFPGWNKFKPDQELIKSWSNILGYQATGIRIQDGLCAIDLDIDDRKIVDSIWSRAIELYPQLRDALIRYGKGEKQLWLCRVDEHFSVIFSSSFCCPNTDPEKDDAILHRLEAFGGGHARQIGCFGAHTLREDKQGFEIEYTWESNESPLEVKFSGLPILKKDHVLNIATIAYEEFEKAGWRRVSSLKGGSEAEVSVKYELTDKMSFDCLDGVTRNLDELAEYAKSDKNSRCSASWVGDDRFKNRQRCLVGIDHRGAVFILETADWVKYKPIDKEDTAIQNYAKALEAKVEEKKFDSEAYPGASKVFQNCVMQILSQWAWCGSRKSPCLPIYGLEELSQTVGNLKISNIRYDTEVELESGKTKRVSPVDVWLCHKGRQDVDGYRYIPDKEPGIYVTEENTRAINSYRAPQRVHVGKQESADFVALWLEFMEHLVPSATERNWFLNWLAHKIQNPTVPGVAILMVTKSFGTGRGTLFDIISNIFGETNVKSVSAEELLGTGGSQSQYTDWIVNTLFVVSEEILPKGNDGDLTVWRRQRAYDGIRERVDPRMRRTRVIRKTLPNYDEWVYASFLLATNHENALPIPENDRRFTIITNTKTPLKQNTSLYKRINAQRNPKPSPRFASALANWLLERDVSNFDAFEPPSFAGKERMLQSNATEIDNVIEDVFENMPYEWATQESILKRIEAELRTQNILDSYPKWRTISINRIKHSWHQLTRAFIDEDRKKKVSIILRDSDFEKDFKAMPPADRAAQYKKLNDPNVGPSAEIKALRKGLTSV